MKYFVFLFCAVIAAASCCLWAEEPVINVNVRDFGAVGDGIADDTAAFQKAIAALTPDTDTVRHTKTITVPAGSYLISDTINLPARTNLMGENARYHQAQSSIVIKKQNFTPVRMDHECSVIGFCFYYPDNQSVVNCHEYPATIELKGTSPVVEKCQFSGAWICISTPKEGANAPGLFKELNGWFHHVGIHMDGGLDIARFEDIHWFVGGTDRQDVASTHYFNERVGFQFGRQDGVMMTRCFIIHGKALLEQLPDTATGRGNHSLAYQINSCWCENVDYAFVFSGMFGAAISDSTLLMKTGGTGIKINNMGSFYNLTVSNTSFRGYNELYTGIEYTAADDRTQNRLHITGCQFTGATPAIKLNANSKRVTIADNHFIGKCDPDNPLVSIGENCEALMIKDNYVNTTQGSWLKNLSRGSKTIIIKDNIISY